jgi:hypothetical protein
MKNAYKILFGKPGWKNYSEDLGEAERIILQRILDRQGGKVWTVSIWLKIGISGGPLLTRL